LEGQKVVGEEVEVRRKAIFTARRQNFQTAKGLKRKKKPAKGGLKVSSSIRLVDDAIEGFP
jgi:hypothetical protein